MGLGIFCCVRIYNYHCHWQCNAQLNNCRRENFNLSHKIFCIILQTISLQLRLRGYQEKYITLEVVFSFLSHIPTPFSVGANASSQYFLRIPANTLVTLGCYGICWFGFYSHVHAHLCSSNCYINGLKLALSNFLLNLFLPTATIIILNISVTVGYSDLFCISKCLSFSIWTFLHTFSAWKSNFTVIYTHNFHNVVNIKHL